MIIPEPPEGFLVVAEDVDIGSLEAGRFFSAVAQNGGRVVAIHVLEFIHPARQRPRAVVVYFAPISAMGASE